MAAPLCLLWSNYSHWALEAARGVSGRHFLHGHIERFSSDRQQKWSDDYFK